MFRSTKTSTDIHDADGVPAPRDALDGSLPWTCRLKLHNPHNLCYMNSGVVALLHTYVLQDRIPSPMRRLARACQISTAQDELFHLQSFLRMCGVWRLVNRQQDTAEFMQHILEQAGMVHAVWDCRTHGSARGMHIDQGGLPITMCLPNEAATLQQVINAWYRQGEYNALTYTDGVVVVQLGRFVNGRKNMTPISGEAIWLPIFAEGINVVWESFRVTAVQVHLGHSPHQGHYRSLLRAGGLWLYQDDGCQAKQVTFSAIHKRHGYLVWLLKSCA